MAYMKARAVSENLIKAYTIIMIMKKGVTAIFVVVR